MALTGRLPPSIPALVGEAALSDGELMAIVDGRRRLTFADLAARVEEAGRAIVAVGLDPGERAAIWAPNMVEWAVAALGILAAGGVLIPVNTRFKGIEARYVLSCSRARLLFTVGEFLGTDYPRMLAEACATDPLQWLIGTVLLDSPSWNEFLRKGVSVGPVELHTRSAALGGKDLSDIIFTSGTTGSPKGVMCTQEQTLSVFRIWAETVGLERGDRYLVVNPFFHTFGFKAGLIASLLSRATVYPMRVFDAAEVMAAIEREKITVLPGPPTLFTSVLDHPERSRYDLSSLRLAVTGAANVPVELIRRLVGELGFDTVLTAYGLTEATGTVTMCRRGDPVETVAATSGRAIPGTDVKVIDSSGDECDRGQAGEVVVRGNNVMVGYLDDPEQTRQVIDSDGWLHTGDIGVMDVDGNLAITDRLKDMFIVGGFNAYPAEIENVLAGYPGVSQVAVIGVPDERMGEVGMAFVVARPGTDVAPDALVEWSRSRMANYKVPRFVRVVAALPVNASGKVLKGDLRVMANQGSIESSWNPQ